VSLTLAIANQPLGAWRRAQQYINEVHQYIHN